MPEKWELFIDALKDDSKKLAKAELKQLIKKTLRDRDVFIKGQGIKLKRYLNQLEAKQITRNQFKSYVQDLKAIVEIRSLKMRVGAKARTQKLAMAIGDLILDKLVDLL